MNHRRIVLAHTMRLKGNPEKVFPLLCPVREYEWVEPWRCDLVYTDSGVAELDCIFRTSFPDDGPEDTWVVSRYEPPNLIEFVRVNPLRAIRYSIRLEEIETGASQWKWEQTITGLNAEGNRLVRGQTDEAFAAEKKTLEKMLNHFLETGTMLRAGKP